MLERAGGDRAGDAIQGLVGQAGFSTEQAQGFLPVVIQKVVELVQGGGLDLGALLGDGGSSLLSRLNAGEIATQTGVAESQASSGIEALVPVLLGALSSRSGGVEGLLSSLGGDKAGDLDNDGFFDLVFGLPSFMDESAQPVVYVVYGALDLEGTVDLTVSGVPIIGEVGSNFGWDAQGGDFDGDGFSQL